MTDFNPYEAPAAVVADPSGTEFLELADRGTRLGAKILDGLILGAGLMIPLIISAIDLLPQPRNGPSSVVFFAVFAVLAGGLLLALMIWNLIWLHRYGQTIAKRILKIRIVRSNGDRVGMGRLLGLRILVIWVIEVIPLLGALFSLVNICFIFRDDRRCLHDLLADTIVIKVSDMNEGGPPGRCAPSTSPLVLPHGVAEPSPATPSA